jgi:hypothetical protein
MRVPVLVMVLIASRRRTERQPGVPVRAVVMVLVCPRAVSVHVGAVHASQGMANRDLGLCRPAPLLTQSERVETPLLRAMTNLTRVHREHEKYYASAPREQAVLLQRHARTLQALADRWSTTTPLQPTPFSPFEGADDLNTSAATQLDGVLFMEGEGEPAEIARLKRDLRAAATDAAAISEWLAAAMDASWGVAATLLEIDDLADQIGERHRIIANDLLAAHMNAVTGRLLDRAADILDHVDFTPAALREDLSGPGVSVGLLYSASELIDCAADLSCESSALVHGNERRWRVFRTRVQAILDDSV